MLEELQVLLQSIVFLLQLPVETAVKTTAVWVAIMAGCVCCVSGPASEFPSRCGTSPHGIGRSSSRTSKQANPYRNYRSRSLAPNQPQYRCLQANPYRNYSASQLSPKPTVISMLEMRPLVISCPIRVLTAIVRGSCSEIDRGRKHQPSYVKSYMGAVKT